jgi:hypothetical protein
MPRNKSGNQSYHIISKKKKKQNPHTPRNKPKQGNEIPQLWEL